MSALSVKSRFAVTLVSNIVRTGLNFLTGIIIARGLGPEAYGDFTFLLGSFIALRQLLDMGTGAAFYTFLAQKSRPAAFVGSYLLWQLLQFALPALLIGLLFPQQWVNLIWVGQQRELVLLALLATFLQQQAWLTVAQIGEASRLTHRVQGFGLGLSILHFLAIVVLWFGGWISVTVIFVLIVLEYVVALPLAYRSFRAPMDSDDARFDWRAMLRDFRSYCQPLILYSWMGFAYAFADTWLLRNYGGATEQGFYAVSNQLASICLFATTAIIQILWKEIAEAHRKQDHVRIETLFRRTSRFVFWFGAAVSGLLIPWSAEITRTLLGPAFTGGAAALAIMLLYHTYGALGQVMGIMFLATGRTKPQVIIGIIFMAISIPVSYLVQAPSTAQIPGFELGAIGMAVKMLALVIINVNVIGWWIARTHGWRLDWHYQPVGIAAMLACGYLAYRIGEFEILRNSLPAQSAVALVAFVMLAAAALWAMPWIAGTTRGEITQSLKRLLALPPWRQH